MSSRVIAYLAISLDGCIAGPDDDLSWLPTELPETHDGLDFATFMDSVGALLMGRRTYDVVTGMDHGWPYGDRPVLVATHRPLDPVVPHVRAVSGPITSLIEQAREAAGERNVYLDGGQLIRLALDAGCLDTLVLTLVPVVLGTGVSLFAGAEQRHALTLESHVSMGAGLVQLTYHTQTG